MLIAVTVFSDLPPTVVPAISMLGGPTTTQARVVGWPAVAAFLLGYYATIVGSNVGLALALHRWIGLLSQRIYRGILLGASALLAVYGFVLIGRPNP
ncbi:MAG: hypothetical protein JOZ81_32140 [Chloroflexi bacterium]|nr:hypothetical protein [Chloroflexota bacterium]